MPILYYNIYIHNIILYYNLLFYILKNIIKYLVTYNQKHFYFSFDICSLFVNKTFDYR